MKSFCYNHTKIQGSLTAIKVPRCNLFSQVPRRFKCTQFHQGGGGGLSVHNFVRGGGGVGFDFNIEFI